MIEKTAQSLVMFFLLTATAFHIGIEQVVVADINLVSAGATAMPEHRTFCSASIGWIQRRQSAKFLPGNIRDRLFFYGLAATMGFSTHNKQCSQNLTGISATALAFPPDSSVSSRSFGFSNYRQISKAFPCEIMGNCLCGTFFAKAAAA